MEKEEPKRDLGEPTRNDAEINDFLSRKPLGCQPGLVYQELKRLNKESG